MAKSRSKKLEENYPKIPKDKDGWWICRYCDKKISQDKRYRAWCNNDCSREAAIRTYQSWARTALFDRENGVCQQCGIDTQELHHELRLLQSSIKWDRVSVQQKQLQKTVLQTLLVAMQNCGYDVGVRYMTWRTLWHMDHIVEHAEGGNLEPENLQTLCVPCHKAKTKKYVGR